MKKNKGFTLIELLAVIVILAIIAIIAVPIILNVIEKSKESSAVDSAYGYINAIENNLAMAEVKSGLVAENKEYSDLREFEETYNITVKGTKPESGRFTLEKRKVVNASFVINGYSVICNKRKCESRGKNVEVLVTYSLNGGTLDKTEESVLKNSTLNLPTPTKNNYVFVGWYTEENGGEEVTNSTPITSDLTLYAHYIQTTTNFEYTGNSQTITLPQGRYKLEVWGAEGGRNIDGSGNTGKGGYSYGTINLTQKTLVYVYVGNKPSEGTRANNKIISGGFNGGGSAWDCSEGSAGGGGATDMRISTDSLYARVIVAGGGGGEGEDGEQGGYGGGTSGGPGNSNGGTQTSAGSYGSFGQGAHLAHDGGAGGGGWYGGGSAIGQNTIPTSGDGSDSNGGAGGSGWIYTEASYNTWRNGNATDANKYLLTSEYYLTDATTIIGGSTFKSPSGTNETGHTGNGYARITYLGK